MKDYKHLKLENNNNNKITLKEILLCISLISLLTIDWATLIIGV